LLINPFSDFLHLSEHSLPVSGRSLLEERSSLLVGFPQDFTNLLLLSLGKSDLLGDFWSCQRSQTFNLKCNLLEPLELLFLQDFSQFLFDLFVHCLDSLLALFG
jgi:hypothetical protein